MTSLPSHRQLLSSLVASLPASPLSQDGSVDTRPQDRLPLLTLHVLFPSIILPALDLLDRSLVTRVRAREPESQSRLPVGARDVGESRPSRRADQASKMGLGEGLASSTSSPPRVHAGSEAPPARFYVIQSLASTLSRSRSRASASLARTYAVHLNAWSCSCPAFALEAFARHAQPPTAPSLFNPRTWSSPVQRSSSPPLPPDARETVSGDKQVLSFGGWSTEEAPSLGEDVPCCKHLLACLLAESWPAILMSGEDRLATRHEMAALGARVY